MSTGAIAGRGADVSSILRFGLTGLKPIKVREIVNLGGIKFRRIYRSFVPSGTIKSFDEYANLTYASVFNNIKIPDKFDVDKLTKYYADKSTISFKTDKEIQEQVEDLKHTKGTIGPFIDFIKFMKIRYHDNIYDMYMTNANNFYASDLPFSIFNDLSREDHLYATYMNLLHHTMNSYQKRFRMRASHDERIFTKLFDQMKKELDDIIGYFDNVTYYSTCLRRLMIIWNAEDYEHLDDVKKITYSNIPEEEFLKIHVKLKSSMKTSRNTMLTDKYYREDDSIDVKPPTLEYLTQDYLRPLFFSELRSPEWNPQ